MAQSDILRETRKWRQYVEANLSGGGGNPFNTPLGIIGDEAVATPPQTWTGDAVLEYFDSDQTDRLAYVGFEGSQAFNIRNNFRGGGSGGTIRIQARDASGNLLTQFEAVGDGSTRIRGLDSVILEETNGDLLAEFDAGSVSLYGQTPAVYEQIRTSNNTINISQVNFKTPVNADSWFNIIYLTWQNNTVRGQWGLTTTGDMFLSNVVHGGTLGLSAEDSGGVQRGALSFDPDAGTTGTAALQNFVFDGGQTVGAGQDNYVLTYDDASGFITLEPAPGASIPAGSAEGDLLAWDNVSAYRTAFGVRMPETAGPPTQDSGYLVFNTTGTVNERQPQMQWSALNTVSVHYFAQGSASPTGFYLRTRGNTNPERHSWGHSSAGVDTDIFEITENLEMFYDSPNTGFGMDEVATVSQIPAAGATELDDLTDVDLTTNAPVSGSLLYTSDGTNFTPTADGTTSSQLRWNGVGLEIEDSQLVNGPLLELFNGAGSIVADFEINEPGFGANDLSFRLRQTDGDLRISVDNGAGGIGSNIEILAGSGNMSFNAEGDMTFRTGGGDFALILNDGIASRIYHTPTNERIADTAAAASGGLLVANGVTGTGARERVLTESDLVIGAGGNALASDTTDTAVSDTVLSDDAELNGISLDANQTYTFEGYIRFGAAGPSGAQWAFQIASGVVTYGVYSWFGVASDPPRLDEDSRGRTASITTAESITITTGEFVDIRIQGTLRAGAGGATIDFQFAQAVSDPGTLSRFAGSWIRFTPIESA